MKRLKRKFKLGFQRFSKYKSRKRSCGSKARSAETADPPSTDATRTTTVSPPQSPVVSSSPLVSELPRAGNGETAATGAIRSRSPDGLARGALSPVAALQPVAPIPKTSTPIHRPPSLKGNEAETDTATLDSDLDDMFEEAWKPGNGLKLADGKPIPWSKGRASPSAAAKYLDDIQGGEGT